MANSSECHVLEGTEQREAAQTKWKLQRASWSDGQKVQMVDGQYQLVPLSQSEAQELDRLIPFVRVDA
jgi:hypothetical protein